MAIFDIHGLYMRVILSTYKLTSPGMILQVDQTHGNKKFDLGPIAYPRLVGAQSCEMLGPGSLFFVLKIFEQIVVAPRKS